MILNSLIIINKVASESRTATGAKKTYTKIEVRGTVKNVTPSGARLYQTQGYSAVDKEVVIHDRHEVPTETIDFAGKVSVKNSHTGATRDYDITTPAVKRGDYITFGVQSASN